MSKQFPLRLFFTATGLGITCLCLFSWAETTPSANVNQAPNDSSSESKLATFGAGCFWCVEAVFQELEGVIAVKSGYSGGLVENPTYKEVCTGLTGHAEVCQIEYDPARVGYDDLLEVFWQTHDPTTLNQQGADRGTQYRSVVFYHDEEQKEFAESYRKKLDASGAWRDPIVTEISAYSEFYDAEGEHQNFFTDNPNFGYCKVVIKPKMKKFRKVFAEKLKTEAAD